MLSVGCNKSVSEARKTATVEQTLCLLSKKVCEFLKSGMNMDDLFDLCPDIIWSCLCINSEQIILLCVVLEHLKK